MLALLEEQIVEMHIDKQEKKFKFYWKYRTEMSDRKKIEWCTFSLILVLVTQIEGKISCMLKPFSLNVLMD